jgi:hypothetical protein
MPSVNDPLKSIVKLNLSLHLTKHSSMKMHAAVDVQMHVFLTSAIVGGVISFKSLPLYPWRKSPAYPFDRRLGKDDMEKWKFLALPGLKLRPLVAIPTALATELNSPW